MKENEYHFIGIGGIGMSGIARILLDEKKSVTGSDLSTSEIVDELEKKGAIITIGHKKEAILNAGTVVFNSRINPENPEYKVAKEKNLKIMHRSELLWEIAKKNQVLAVTGTHGKTTTSSLLSFLLLEAGWDPSFAVGGIIPGHYNAKKGSSKYFVLEADESDGTFLNYHPFGAIITNIECEHMEHYKTEKNLEESFSKFASQVSSKEHLFISSDDPKLKKLIPQARTYGFCSDSDARISKFHQNTFSISFDLHFEGKSYEKIELPLTGRHNAQNASSVFALALCLGISEETIRNAFRKFPGVKRRLERMGEINSISLFDDYAHHPTEIKKTLLALRKGIQDRRLIVLFEPHRYGRLRDLFSLFVSSFDIADELICTDLYSAGENPIEGISSENLVHAIEKNSTLPVSFIPFSSLVQKLIEKLRPHDVLVTMGAGKITQIHEPLLNELKSEPPKKFRVGVIFGGKSCEHEISLRSCRFVRANLKSEIYEPIFFAIDKGGEWLCGKEAIQFLEDKKEIPQGSGKHILSPEICEELKKCEFFFPVLHGPFGEDGTIQGFFEMLQKPYVGPDHRTAANSMDKVMTKRLLMEAGVPSPKYITFTHAEWRLDEEEYLLQIQKNLKFPLIVKPRNLGSSVGVSKIEKISDLKEAIDFAFRYDRALLIEEAIENARELEFPVLGSEESEIYIANPGEKVACGKLVDYEMKYSSNPVKTDLNPTLSKEILEEGRAFVLAAYKALSGTCMMRIDCLLDPKGNYWFFEVNPIPGMTPLSLFPKIWMREGIGHSELLDRLIIGGLARYRRQIRHINPL